MKIRCATPKEVGILVRRCVDTQKSSSGCYHCILRVFCDPHFDLEQAVQVEDLCEVVPEGGETIGETENCG